MWRGLIAITLNRVVKKEVARIYKPLVRKQIAKTA
jgi:hypothetical protein